MHELTLNEQNEIVPRVDLTSSQINDVVAEMTNDAFRGGYKLGSGEHPDWVQKKRYSGKTFQEHCQRIADLRQAYLQYGATSTGTGRYIRSSFERLGLCIGEPELYVPEPDLISFLVELQEPKSVTP